MESNATDKPVPRAVDALLSDERLILRETRRAVTPFGGIAVFISFLGKIGFVEAVRQHMPIRLGSPNQIDPTFTFTAFLVSVLVGARRFAHVSLLRGDSGAAYAAGYAPFSHRRYHPQFVPPVRYGPGAAVVRTAGGMADAAFAGARRRLHPGFGFDGLGTLWQAGRFAQRTQPAQARTAQSSSSFGRAERSALPPPRLAPQRQLRNQPWRGGVSQRSSRAVGTAPEN